MHCDLCAETMPCVAVTKKNDHIYSFFHCFKCGKNAHIIDYVYTPSTCPKHQYEHIGIEFNDSKHSHEIFQVDRCDRCGALRKTARHTEKAGFSKRVEVDDPRVVKNLLMNQSACPYILGKELSKEAMVTKHVVLPNEADV